jgi:hypothetical protein
MTSVGVPSAAPDMGWTSVVGYQHVGDADDRDRFATVVFPVITIGWCLARLDTSVETSSSAGDPISTTFIPDSASRSANSAYRSGGQRLARLFTDPGQRTARGFPA